MCQYRGTVFTTQTPRGWIEFVRSTRKKNSNPPLWTLVAEVALRHLWVQILLGPKVLTQVRASAGRAIRCSLFVDRAHLETLKTKSAPEDVCCWSQELYMAHLMSSVLPAVLVAAGPSVVRAGRS